MAGDVENDNDTDTNDTVPGNGGRSGNKHIAMNKKISGNGSPQTAGNVYTLYRVDDMKVICQSNVINLEALIDLYEFNFTNGHLKVYIDGTLVFDGDVDDDLSRVIFEIIEKFLGKHEMTVEFTDSSGKTETFNETIIVR